MKKKYFLEGHLGVHEKNPKIFRNLKKIIKRMRVHENIIIIGNLSETDIPDRRPNRRPRYVSPEIDMPDRRPGHALSETYMPHRRPTCLRIPIGIPANLY